MTPNLRSFGIALLNVALLIGCAHQPSVAPAPPALQQKFCPDAHGAKISGANRDELNTRDGTLVVHRRVAQSIRTLQAVMVGPIEWVEVSAVHSDGCSVDVKFYYHSQDPFLDWHNDSQPPSSDTQRMLDVYWRVMTTGGVFEKPGKTKDSQWWTDHLYHWRAKDCQ